MKSRGMSVFQFMLFTLVAISFQPASAMSEVPDTEWHIRLSSSGTYQLETDLDDKGSFDVQHYSVRLGAQRAVTGSMRIGINIWYGFEDWEFSEPAAFGQAPWDSLHRIGLGMSLRYSPMRHWFVHLIPTIESAGESGVDVEDTIIYGGIVSAGYHFGPKFMIGIGGSVLSKIEDVDVRPFLALKWEINDRLRLSNPRSTGPISPAGLELVYCPSRRWEFAAGFSRRSNRFRLDDSAPALNGVGQVEDIPVWLRTGYTITSSISVELYGGWALAGKLGLEDEKGHLIQEEDYNLSPFVGLSLKGNF